MSIIPTGVYQGAIFSRMVMGDAVEPKGEVSYKGYCRVPVRVVDDVIHGFNFPKSVDETPCSVECIALLDVYNKVILSVPFDWGCDMVIVGNAPSFSTSGFEMVCRDKICD